MDATEHDQNESETSPFQVTCPRHGAKVHRHHGCPKCVMEEVRRHENRIHMPLELEPDAPVELDHDAPIELEHDAPIPADGLGSVNPFSIEIV